ncbi:NUDIX hydrolase [Virgibacillus flavescens]|uniref:NUDIX hydrolase n=1 Tax=Virgibacillus flavescens TaxID=1611422 RepID=UPI003D34E7B1
MKKWMGSAGLCINEKKQILMVKQGLPDEEKLWTIPSGGKEANETFEACCIRETYEETGYLTSIVKPLFIKEGTTFGIPVTVHYFQIKVDGGSPIIQDPDELIYEIAWKSANEIKDLELSFPEDRNFLLNFINEEQVMIN